jgi:hypothetical protein
MSKDRNYTGQKLNWFSFGSPLPPISTNNYTKPSFLFSLSSGEGGRRPGEVLALESKNK